MWKQWNNEKGITLVELLAAVVLASIVMLLVFSVLMSGTKQYKGQLEKNNQLTDISYALKMITKDIRKTKEPQIISVSEIELNGINYSKVGNTITRNGDVIARNIEIFKVKDNYGTEHYDENNIKWFIEIKSLDQKKTKKTEIYLRKGDE
ncbi:PilW family protein [Psychrobacillus psychrodurans]|uniref:PilW family protein n=1 Tax=Psychrobacillus psychrodurans TaxID=126157 RepID=UPI0008E14DF9|nr:prepilin-type N-terminal cleavage/methylation domain-containing protein [Psychrobacillus psychrodurans]MCZ8542144.1 prepilin-type N-terminal cleavage/methylation domain-containing protein [Psychrobacillus psychrodurans]SFN17391.1 Type IV pilin N-term methylation site GFxxxE [Psychrobacillus psychrodurans]